MRLEIRFNNLLDTKKKHFLTIKSKFFKVSKMVLFPCFWSNNAIFSLFVFAEKKTRNKVYDVLDRKETFYDYENNNFSTTQKWHFSKGVNPRFWLENAIFFISCFRSE